MKFKTSLLLSVAFGALLLAVSLVSAETTTKPETNEAVESATETAQAAAKVDQASIVPKNDEDNLAGIKVWENIYQVLSPALCELSCR